MSMTSALNNAMSGLNAVGRSAQLVSSNISNALTPGYSRRELIQTASLFGGVQVDGIKRIVNPVVLSDRRLSEAQLAQDDLTATFLSRVQSLLGQPDDPGSLTGRMTTLEGRLIEAASRPDSTTRLVAAIDGANDLVDQVISIGRGIQSERETADRAISIDVEVLNTTLTQVHQLNGNIARLSGLEEDTSALMDQRRILIDNISEIVPLRILPRDRGGIALMTTGGQILLDSKPAEIGFTRANAITPGMTPGSGLLSGITINGQPVAMNTGSGRLDGGRLETSFAIRDTLAVGAQSDIDAFAQDLIARFEAPGVDPTLTGGNPGLFTDGGAAIAATPAAGLAQRLSLNALVDPDQGGSAARLRDGLGATAPGNPGNSTILQSLSDTLSAPRVTSLGLSLSAAAFTSELVSRNSGALFRAEQAQTFSQNRTDALREQELTDGVDTDQEMQKLLLIEQSYSANARVIQAIDEMMRRLLEI